MYRCSGTLARAPVAKSESFFGSSLKPSKTRGKKHFKTVWDSSWGCSFHRFLIPFLSVCRSTLPRAGRNRRLDRPFQVCQGAEAVSVPAVFFIIGCRTPWLPDALGRGAEAPSRRLTGPA